MKKLWSCRLLLIWVEYMDVDEASIKIDHPHGMVMFGDEMWFVTL